jgi:hypothetical protein
MDNDDLRFKFDFSRLTMKELINASSLSSMSLINSDFVLAANVAILEIAEKTSITAVSKIPADMLFIVIKEFSESYEEWAKEMGWIK